MLPLIKINPNNILHVVENFLSPDNINIVGQTFAYRFNDLLSRLKEKNENMDRYFSTRILEGMSKKPLKSEMLFFYSPHGDFSFISAALLKLNINLNWMSKFAGYYESGQDYLKQNSQPFMYWDGNNLHRIYNIPDYDPSFKYINDFGSLYGISTSEAEDFYYNRTLLNEDSETWDYSIVPDESEEIVTINGNKYVLLHSRYVMEKLNPLF